MTPTPETCRPALGRNGAYWLFWGGESLSALGTSISGILVSLVAVVTLDANPLWVGAIGAMTWLPWVLLGLLAGAWVDEHRPGAVMFASSLTAAVTVASVPVTGLLGRLTLPHLVAVTFIVGTCTVFSRSAYPKLLTELVDRPDLPRANSYLATSESVAHIAGPPIGGILATLIAPALGLVLDAMSYVVAAATLLRLPWGRRRATGGVEPLGRRIREGWRVNFGDPYLRYFTLQGALANLGLTGLQTLLVLLAVRELGLSETAAGLILGAQGLGALLGALAAPAVGSLVGTARATRWLLGGVGAAALLIPVTARGLRVGFLAVGLLLVGAFVVCGNVIRSAWRQTYIPLGVMARANMAAQSVNFSLMPVAALGAGALADATSIRTAVSAACILMALAGFSVLASPLRRDRDLPDGQALLPVRTATLGSGA